MNKGTQRGKADGFQFDILPKLRDVKSQVRISDLTPGLLSTYHFNAEHVFTEGGYQPRTILGEVVYGKERRTGLYEHPEKNGKRGEE